jgi:hypothetical protein
MEEVSVAGEEEVIREVADAVDQRQQRKGFLSLRQTAEEAAHRDKHPSQRGAILP